MIPVVGYVRQLFVRSYLTHEIKRSYRCFMSVLMFHLGSYLPDLG